MGHPRPILPGVRDFDMHLHQFRRFLPQVSGILLCWRGGEGAPMSNYRMIAHTLKRAGVDPIFWDTSVLDIDWGGPGIHARIINVFAWWEDWRGRRRDLTALTVGQLIELGIPREQWMGEPRLGRKSVDAIFQVFDHVVRTDTV
jgi:hypothetical protein